MYSHELRILYKYPWLPGGEKIFEEIMERGIPAEDTDPDTDGVILLTGRLSALFDRYSSGKKNLLATVKKIILYALDKKEEHFIPEESDFNLVVFYTVKTVLAALNNRFISNHVANFTAKCYEKILEKEKLNILAELMRKCGYDCSYGGNSYKFSNAFGSKVIYPFKIHFTDYVALIAGLKDLRYNLVNQYLIKGYVYLYPQPIIKMLRETVRRRTIPVITGDPDELREILLKIPAFAEIFSAIEVTLELLKKKRKDYGFQGTGEVEPGEKPIYEEYPPCIKYILDKANEGENLTHNERLHIAFFYANTGHSVEETVDVFRTLPDFDESIARYQVEFSRGIGGKGKKYRVFGCAKLRSMHICRADDPVFGDEICSRGVKRKGESEYTPIKSPLDYVFWKRVELRRKRRREHNR